MLKNSLLVTSETELKYNLILVLTRVLVQKAVRVSIFHCNPVVKFILLCSLHNIINYCLFFKYNFLITHLIMISKINYLLLAGALLQS